MASGDRIDPAGRLALAEYFAANIEAVAEAANASGETTVLGVDPHELNASFREIMRDVEARTVLLAGANEAVAVWAGDYTRTVGDDLAAGHGDLFALLNQNESIPRIQSGALDLGNLLGQPAAAVRANVKDEQEAAAEVAGVLSFVLSQGLGYVATGAGAALGGGVGGLAAKHGADQLAELASEFITGARNKLARSDQQELKADFIDLVEQGLHHTMVCALWADERVRAHLRAGQPDDYPPVVGPPLTDAGRPPVVIDPPFEHPEGVLRVPAPGEEPAYEVFRKWLKSRPGGEFLGTAATSAVEATGIQQSFTGTIVQSLFEEG